MAKKKRSKKMDPKLISAKQRQEIQYISSRHKIPIKTVREVVARIGRSRVKVYAELRTMGFTVKTGTYC